MGATLEDVRAVARRVFRTEQSAEAFLRAPCVKLGGAPIDLAASGRATEVLFFLERLERFAPATPGQVPGYRSSR